MRHAKRSRGQAVEIAVEVFPQPDNTPADSDRLRGSDSGDFGHEHGLLMPTQAAAIFTGMPFGQSGKWLQPGQALLADVVSESSVA